MRNLLERRSLLFQLVRRDFEQRFIGSAMGWIWGLIQPLVLLLSWTLVFQVFLKIPPPAGVGSYPLFLFAGMLPWLLFSETVQRSATSLLEQANLITKTVFPSEIIPVSVFLSALVSHRHFNAISTNWKVQRWSLERPGPTHRIDEELVPWLDCIGG